MEAVWCYACWCSGKRPHMRLRIIWIKEKKKRKTCCCYIEDIFFELMMCRHDSF